MKAQYERYAAIRDKEGLIDAEVAKQTGIAQSTFSDWKVGRSAPKIDKLFRIAAVLKAHVEDLLEEDQQDIDAAADRDLDAYEAMHGADGYLAQQRGVSAW